MLPVTPENESRPVRHGILSLSIKDRSVLHAAFMPFLKNGGLFIPTTRTYELGNEVFMLLKLMEESERIPVAGTVVWITPSLAQSNRAAGIGIHFKDADVRLRQKIENMLAGKVHPDKATHTL